jgi:hypothetical protein
MTSGLMHGVRSRIRRVAVLWLFCQAGAVAGAPFALWAAPSALVALADHDCCPGVAPGQVCPMHHTREGVRHCAMSSACGASDAALLTVAGLIAPPAVFSMPSVDVRPEPVVSAAFSTASRAARPESPPPRA